MSTPPTFEELEHAWLSGPPSPRARGSVSLICVRRGGGVHESLPRVRVSVEGGVEGDRWAAASRPNREAQVTVMTARVAELVTAGHTPLHQPGDNFQVDLDLSEEALPTGSVLRIGGVRLVVSAVPHAGCGKFEERFGAEALAWVNGTVGRSRRLRGVNCRVLEGGEVAIGDPVEVEPR